MFENYKASETDFRILLSTIRLTRSAAIKNIFPRGGLENIDVILFDSSHCYVFSDHLYKLHLCELPWSHSIRTYAVPHGIHVNDAAFRGCGGIKIRGIEKLLHHDNFFFCPPVTCFKKMQSLIRRPGGNPYTTTSGFVFSIIHEFGHAYYHLYSKSGEKFRRLVLSLISPSASRRCVGLSVPTGFVSELFATLCELASAKACDGRHYRSLRRHMLEELKENSRNQFSLDEPHRYAKAYALSLIRRSDWNEILLKL